MKKQINIIKLSLLNLIAILISVTAIAPLFWLVYSSLKSKEEFLLDAISFPKVMQFDNYVKAITSGDLFTAAANSAFNVVVNMVLVLLVSVTTGYFFARHNFKGKKIVHAIYLIGMLIPLYALLIPVYLEFTKLHLVNTRFALILPYFAMQISIAIFLVESFIKDIPYSIEEAAILDGCSLRQIIFKMIMPISTPIIATVCILTLLSTWNEFPFASVLSSTKDLRTMSVAVQAFTTGKNIAYTEYMAALVTSSLPVILAYLLFSKQVINGLTAGSIKE